MITGFNTDVHYDGCVYHVQTEDRGRENPIVESLVYVGGTVIAKKLTPYDEQLKQGATEETITSLLRRQHQVMIAAIKAGRIEDLVRHSEKEDQPIEEVLEPVSMPPAPAPQLDLKEADLADDVGQERSPPQPERIDAQEVTAPPVAQTTGNARPGASSATSTGSSRVGLNLDQVISDYLKRSAEQGRLDLKVLSPNVFTAGKNVGLKVQVHRGETPEAEAIVTVKIIGTAFKPQVHISRADRSGVASFSLNLPSFTAGTAAIVIEAQSNRGRGELKHLIRRA